MERRFLKSTLAVMLVLLALVGCTPRQAVVADRSQDVEVATSESMVFSPYVPAACLADTIALTGGSIADWEGINSPQKMLLWNMNPRLGVSAMRSIDGLKSMAARDAAPLNAFFQENGVPITVPGFEGVGCASFLEVAVRWPLPGEKTKVQSEGRSYPALKLNNRVITRMSGPEREDVVRIYTQTKGVYAYVSIQPRPEGHMEMSAVAARLTDGLQENDIGIDSLTMPMVSLDRPEDVRWFVGIHVDPSKGKDYVGWAQAHTRLMIDHLGAEGSMAMAGIVFRGAPSNVVIDRPFLFWIQKEGDPMPSMVAWVARDGWKEPKR